MPLMRAFTGFLCGLVAVAAALVALPAAWVGLNVADEDGYVAFSAPLATDAEMHEAVAGGIAAEVVGGAGLPDELTPTLAGIFENSASRLSEDPGFESAWVETQRLAHRSVLAAGNGDAEAGVDLAPLAQFLVDDAAASLPIDLDVPDTLIVELEQQPSERELGLVRATRSAAGAATGVAVIAGGASLVLARRRSTAAVWLGLGVLAVAALLTVVSRILMPELVEGVGARSEVERAFQELLADRAAESFTGWLLWVAISGAVAVGGGLIMRLATGGSRRSLA